MWSMATVLNMPMSMIQLKRSLLSFVLNSCLEEFSSRLGTKEFQNVCSVVVELCFLFFSFKIEAIAMHTCTLYIEYVAAFIVYPKCFHHFSRRRTILLIIG